MSGRVAFFTEALGSLVYASPAQADTPKANATTDRPGQAFGHETDSTLYPQGGQFDFSSSNQWIDTSLGSASLSAGSRTIPEILTDLNVALQAVSASFLVTYSSASRKFSIFNTVAFQLLWASGAHAGSSMGAELGWSTSADTASSSLSTADKVRTGTHTWLAFQASAATAAHLAVALLDAGDDGDTDDVVLYAMAAFPTPTTRARFAAVATGTYAFSDQSDEPESEIQAAIPAGAVTASWWVVSWRHIDEALYHRVGLARVYGTPLQSSTRTVRAIQGAGIVDLSESIGVDNYWPVRQGQFWRLPLTFDSWGIADWRTVGHALARWGRARGLVVALNWQGLAAGTLTAQDEAERGYLLFGALVEMPRDAYKGQGSDYVTADIVIEQIR